MKKIKYSVLSFILALTMLGFVFVPSKDAIIVDAADATTQSYQDQISSLEEKQKNLKNKIADLKNQKAGYLEYKSNLDELGVITQQKIAAAESLQAELDEKIKSTEEAIVQKEKDIGASFDKFLESLVISYEEGDASYLELLFDADGIVDFLTRMDMVSSMLDYDRDVRIQYENEKTELEAAKASLEEAKITQAQLVETLKADKAEYEILAEQQASYISSLDEDINAANEAYEQAKQQENALDAQLQSYLQSLQQKEQTVYVGGEFIWPLSGYYNISSGFGWRTLGGVSDFHRGIDIPAPGGTPIHASNSGTVVTATGHSSYGNYVIINHGGGKSTLYAHMSAIGCGVGQTVNQGDVIGYVGSTGYSTGNHLHIEVRINGEAQDPLGYLAR